MIRFMPRQSSSFSGKEEVSLSVETSEPMKELNLTVAGKRITAQKSAETSFIFKFTMPDLTGTSSPLKKQPLEFTGTAADGGTLLALQGGDPGETSKNISRFDETSPPPGLGRVAAASADTRHELKLCEETTPKLALTANPDGNDAVLVNANNGKAPFRYSRDGGELVQTNRFSGLQQGVQYNFKVQDNVGCTAETPYTLNTKSCDTRIAGVQSNQAQTFRHDLGSNAGTVTVSYEMFPNPDRMDIFYNGVSVASTNGLVSGRGILSFNYPATTGFPTFCIIQMLAPNAGTEWYYDIKCPGRTTLRVATVTKVTVQTQYQVISDYASITVLAPTDYPTTQRYNVRFRYLRDSLWTTLTDQLLPLTLSPLSAERETEIDVSLSDNPKTEPANTSPIRVVPNPNEGQFTVQFDSYAPEPAAALFEIVDSRGVVVVQQPWQVNPGKNQLPVTLPSSASGVLVVRVRSGEKIWVSSFLVSR